MKILSLLYFFCLFPLVSTETNPNVKIVVVWGLVNSFAPDPIPYTISWEDCIKKCLEMDDCILIEMWSETTCNVHTYGLLTTMKKDKSTGKLNGFKRVMTSCPADGSTAPLFGETDILETYQFGTIAYRSRITETQNPIRWDFYTRFFIKCQPDSIASVRGTNKVCISPRKFESNTCKDQVAGVSLCNTNNGIGLTGPYSTDERDAIDAFMKPQLNVDPIKGGFTSVLFWIDGTREYKISMEWTDVTDEPYQLVDDTLIPADYNSVLKTGDAKSYYENSEFACCNIAIRTTAAWVFPNRCDKTDSFMFCSMGAVCKTKPLVEK